MTIRVFQPGDDEVFRWTNVMPGDVVVSPNTRAYRLCDFHERYNPTTELYRLHSSPLLVVSRIDGVPHEEDSGAFTTFVVLSRHGLLVIIQTKKKRR